MKYTLFIVSLILAACAGTSPDINPMKYPELLIQYPLPELPASVKLPPSFLDLEIFVQENGSVERVRLLTGSGSASWDSLAIQTIRQWRFLPARVDDHAISKWIRLRASIRYSEPLMMPLSGIFCRESSTSDTVYGLLESGAAFDELAKQYSSDPSASVGGMIGTVNIYTYPENVRRELENLDRNKYTHPIRYGNHYVIFKRLQE